MATTTEWFLCSACNGSGEGYVDGSRCACCRGRGEVRCDVDTDDEDDGYRDDGGGCIDDERDDA